MARPPLRNRRRQNSFTLRSPQPRRQARVPQIPDPAQVRQHLETQVNVKSLGKKQGDSDDSDQLVTTRTSGRNRKRQEIYASGGVGKGDKPGAYPSKVQRTRSMREDTQEILKQQSRSGSRSVSRTNSEHSIQTASATILPPGRGKENVTLKGSDIYVSKGLTSELLKKPEDREKVNVDPHHKIQAPASVIGKIKPRKRQDSILRLIQADGNDDSTLVSQDEAEFLPDAVSTPVIAGPTAILQRSSLKRKRAPELSESALNRQSVPLSSPTVQERSSTLRSPPDIPQPSRSQRRKLTTSSLTQEEKNSIMAPPESSDSEDAVDEDMPTAKMSVQKNKKNHTLVPSTEALQSLMPSRKREPLRKQRPKDDFALPEDSKSSSDTEKDEDEVETSVFVPGSARKKQTQAPNRSRSVRNTRKITSKARTRTKVEGIAKSTNTIPSATPSPVRVRTPLPLSSVKASTRRTQAKSPSKQDITVMRDKTPQVVNTPMARKVTAAKGKFGRKQYGGFHLRELGKENETVESSEGLSNGDDIGGLGKSIRNADGKAGRQVDGPEIKAWKKKWADIDDFQMEIEEVSISTRSSSPMAR